MDKKRAYASTPSFFHLTTQPVSSILHLVKVAERPRLSEFQQVFLSRKGGEFYMRTCKSFLNMKSLKRSSWICSAWEVLPIPSLNRQKCSTAKWPRVCQKSRSPSSPGACDKSLYFICELNVEGTKTRLCEINVIKSNLKKKKKNCWQTSSKLFFLKMYLSTLV